jgi:hypothetical protein
MTKRTWSWIFLFSALALMAATVWLARHQFTVLTRWKKSEGTLQRYQVLRNHDADGYLYFQTQAQFRYMADGKELTGSADSYFGSADYGWIALQFFSVKPGGQYPIYYDPAKPEVFEFLAGFNKLYFKTPLQCLTAALGCLLLSFVFRRLSRPPKRCPQCQRAVQSFFRYCPDCGESISMEPHRMQT